MSLPYQVPITVMIPIYNSESFLNETIDSVISQTFSDFELLLLDDGSTDGTPDIVKQYTDLRIRYILCKHDFISTLNRGLKLARGKYIALLDHDDMMMPNRLQIQYNYLESHPKITACGGYMHSFGWYSKKIEAPLEYEKLMKDMIMRSPMLNPTGFIRREAIIMHKIRYQKGYSFAADFKFWSDLVKVGKVVNIPKVLTLYRTSPLQTSVVTQVDSTIGALKIQQEIIEYFLSLIDKDDFYSNFDDNFYSTLETLKERSLLSTRVFFVFMHDLICGLCQKKIIKIK